MAAKDVIEQGRVVMEPVVGDVAGVAVEDVAVDLARGGVAGAAEAVAVQVTEVLVKDEVGGGAGEEDVVVETIAVNSVVLEDVDVANTLVAISAVMDETVRRVDIDDVVVRDAVVQEAVVDVGAM